MDSHFPEQRLYRRSSGRRRAILMAGSVIGAGIGVVWLLVGFGVLPGRPAAIVAASIQLPALFIPFAALWDNPGENRTWLERLSSMAFVFTVVNAIIESTWELSWVALDLIGVMPGATFDDRWLWGWLIYGHADIRYVTSNPTVFGLEFTNALAGPLQIVAVIMLLRGHYLVGNWMSLLLLWPFLWSTVPNMVSEWHVDFVNIHGGSFGFWVVFVGMNVPFLLAACLVIPARIMEISYWTRRSVLPPEPRQGPCNPISSVTP